MMGEMSKKSGVGDSELTRPSEHNLPNITLQHIAISWKDSIRELHKYFSHSREEISGKIPGKELLE